MSKYIPLSDDEVKIINKQNLIRQQKKNDVLLSEGEQGTECYLVLSGCIRAYYLIDGVYQLYGMIIVIYEYIMPAGTELNQIEEFGILQTIRKEKAPRKTEVFYANLFELSSGTDMLNRMKKRGMINEYDDREDKRSKRLELTEKGETVCRVALSKIERNAKMLLHDLKDDDIELCIQLLKNIEIKFSAQWQKHKGKNFDEIFEEVMDAGYLE